ncbi:hypothetical protein [Paraburkholderia caffeinilytica]|uniref:hypothetical protein n=1 Tax=Paraburkholderia caffeinilytica TaxID=1761016 RepID=UPI0038B92803
MAARQKASFMPLIKKPLELPVLPGRPTAAKFAASADRPVDRSARLSTAFSADTHQSGAVPMHDHVRNVR